MLIAAKRVLLVEDNDNDYLAVRALLSDIASERFEVEWAKNVEAARQLLNASRYDVCLIEHRPGTNDGLKFIQAREAGDPPFILLAATEELEVDIAATRAGAMDYLIRGQMSAPILGRSIRNAIGRTQRESELEAALYQSQLVTTTVSTLIEGMVITDALAPDKPIIYVNDAFCAMTGYSPEEVLGRNCRFLQGKETDPQTVEQMRQAMREQRDFRGVIRNYRKDGTPFWNGLKLNPVFDGAGQLIKYVGLQSDITEQRQAEIALHETEARKAAILETALDCIIAIDQKSCITEWNPAAEMTFGHARADVLGRSLAEIIIPPSLREAHQRGMKHYLETGVGPVLGRRVETSALHADGHEFPVELAITRIAGGGPARFSAYLRDITARKQAEAASARLAAIVESSDDAIISKTLDGIIMTWNAGAQTLYGYTVGEAIGQSISMFAPDDRPDEMPRLLEQIRRGEPVKHYETVRVHKDGRLLDVSLSISPLRDAEGRIVGASSIKRDITQRKRDERELRQANELLKAVTEGTIDAVFAKDCNGRYLMMNGAGARMLGKSADEVLGKTHRELSSAPGAQDFSAADLRVLESGEVQTVEEVFVLDGEARTFLATKGPLRDYRSDIVGIVGISRDITPRKQSEAALVQAKDELEARVAARTLEVKQSERQALARARQHEAVAELGKRALSERSLSEVDLNTLLLGAATLVAVTLEVELCSFWELLPDSETLRLRTTVGPLEAWTGIADTAIGTNSQVGYTALLDETVVVEDLARETRFQPWPVLLEQGVTNAITVPVKDGLFYGVLAVASTQSQKFNQHDTYFLQAIANVLASALARKHADTEILQLNANLQGANEELRGNETRLLQGNRTFAALTQLRATTDQELQEALHQITEAGSEMLDVERCSVWTFNAEGTVLRCVDLYERAAKHHSQGLELEEDEHYFPTIKVQRMMVADDALTNPATRHYSELYLKPNGISSVLDVALVVNGHSIGVLCCEHTGRARGWQTEDQMFASSMASACSLVLESYQRAAAEEASRLARMEAEQARHEAETANEAKSEFLSRISHELRTPLNSIIGFGQIFERQQLSALQQESIGYILKGGRHLLNLINEVLDIARVESGRLELFIEPVALSEVVAECCALVRPLSQEKEIRVVDDSVGAASYYSMADRQRLKQVLLNLLSNAIKYNRQGGNVTLSLAKVEDRVQLRVHDTGPGISEADLKKLFTPFERLGAADSQIEGTGLGLVLSQRIVTAMGGALCVESKPGAGTTFWVELPQTESPLSALNESVTDAASQALPESEKTYTVLSIEDNLSNIRLLEAILESRPDIKLLAAMQGSLGLELARQHHPDAILLDLNLPGISGSEVLEQLRAADDTRDIPVVVVSADGTKTQIERLMAAGAFSYLTKPIDVNEFLNTLDEVLGIKAN